MPRMPGGVIEHGRERRHPDRVGMSFEIGQQLGLDLRGHGEIVTTHAMEPSTIIPPLRSACVRTFGKEAVMVRLNELATQSESYGVESLAWAIYRAEAKR